MSQKTDFNPSLSSGLNIQGPLDHPLIIFHKELINLQEGISSLMQNASKSR